MAMGGKKINFERYHWEIIEYEGNIYKSHSAAELGCEMKSEFSLCNIITRYNRWKSRAILIVQNSAFRRNDNLNYIWWYPPCNL